MTWQTNLAGRSGDPYHALAGRKGQIFRKWRIGIGGDILIIVPDLDAGLPVDQFAIAYHREPGGAVNVMAGNTGDTAGISTKIPVRAETPARSVQMIIMPVCRIPEIRMGAIGIGKR